MRYFGAPLHSSIGMMDMCVTERFVTKAMQDAPPKLLDRGFMKLSYKRPIAYAVDGQGLSQKYKNYGLKAHSQAIKPPDSAAWAICIGLGVATQQTELLPNLSQASTCLSCLPNLGRTCFPMLLVLRLAASCRPGD